MKTFSVVRGKCLIIMIFVSLIIIIPAKYLWAEDQSNVVDCSQLENEEDRLACYDKIARQKSDKAEPAVARSDETPESDSDTGSYLSKLWELDENKPRGKYALMMHRSNYILPFSYNSSPNEEPFQANSTGEDIEKTEVKFQLSLKVKLWQDIFGKDVDLWFGYTQKSFWQLYDFAESSPFRETNYEPEVLFNFRTHFRLLGMDARMITVGFNHQSNGRSEPYSRSWNRIVGNLGLERGNTTLLLKTWYRIPDSDEKDNNPDLDDYMGHGEIWGYYVWNGHRFGVMLRNNLKFNDNRGAVQLEWSIPISEKVGFYIQYFNGYGESLLDYYDNANRISLGVVLINWN
ncbi:MAG: phospholipase A [Deltaproteobacteria bacterium]|nr:phospholipase A [Deltaproteobacteria bacterium]